MFLDCLVLKIREGGSVQRRACYLALGVTLEGDRDVLGMWFQETEGAKFWIQVLNDLKQRGVQDILICCVDGLKGFPEAIEAVFPRRGADLHRPPDPPQPQVRPPPRARAGRPRPQTDLHRRRRRRRPNGARALRREVGRAVPGDHPGWLNAWEHVIPFLAFPAEVRRVIYTTNAIEALNRQLRKAIKTKGHFPNEEAARKLIYLAIINAVPAWTKTRNWTAALLAFKIHFGDRLPDNSNQEPAYTENRTPSAPWLWSRD